MVQWEVYTFFFLMLVLPLSIMWSGLGKRKTGPLECQEILPNHSHINCSLGHTDFIYFHVDAGMNESYLFHKGLQMAISILYFEFFLGKTLNNVQGSILHVNDTFLNFQLTGADLFLSSEYFCK